jgi:hypothetical protein
MRVVIDSAFRNKSIWPRAQVRDQITSSNQNMKSIRLVESNIAFAETTVVELHSIYRKSRSVTVAHGTYTDGTEIAVALQTALTTQASDLDVTVTYVDGRLKFESGNDFTIDDTDVNATLYGSFRDVRVIRFYCDGRGSRRRSLFHFQRHGLRSYSTIRRLYR